MSFTLSETLTAFLSGTYTSGDLDGLDTCWRTAAHGSANSLPRDVAEAWAYKVALPFLQKAGAERQRALAAQMTQLRQAVAELDRMRAMLHTCAADDEIRRLRDEVHQFMAQYGPSDDVEALISAVDKLCM